MSTNAATSTSSATVDQPTRRLLLDRHRSRISSSSATMIAMVCIIIIAIATGRDGVATITAFSPSYRRAASPPNIAIIHHHSRNVRIVRSDKERTTRLFYKHLDHGDNKDEDDSINNKAEHQLDARNETAINEGKIVSVSVDVNVEIKKDIIYYNDLDDDASISTSSYNASFSGSTSSSSSVESTSNNDSDGLITELENVIQEKNIELDTTTTPDDNNTKADNKKANKPKEVLAAIEPSKSKPAKKFISPIQLIKKVPKVEPIHMSTVFFLKLIGDPMWPSDGDGGSSGTLSSMKQVRPPKKKKKKKEEEPTSTATSSIDTKEEKNKPVIENWKTKMEKLDKKSSTAFMATNYLEGLDSSNNKAAKNPKNPNEDKTDEDTADTDSNSNNDLLKSLRNQQGALRTSQLQSQQQAMYDAMRRTNPKEAIKKREEAAQNLRKRKEREKLERLYVERKERIDAKKRNEERYKKEKEREKMLLEEKARERSESEGDEVAAAAAASADKGEENVPKTGKRGIPILDRPSLLHDVPPLLVGGTLTFQYSDLTPFQKRAVEVAQMYHGEQCERMKVEGDDDNGDDANDGEELSKKAGDEGRIQAAPIIAVTDGFTPAAVATAAANAAAELLPPTPQQQKSRYGTSTRFATIASIKMVYDSNSEPVAIKLMGVGRAFLNDYFSSRDAGLTKEEEELSNSLDRIQDIDSEVEWYDEEEYEEELAVVMAEFDLFLDDSSILPASSSNTQPKDGEDARTHAITELYRSANKVYRLHEERKKLVAGLMAGEARLRMGQGKAAAAAAPDENCLVTFEDCDGLGLIGGGIVMGDATSNFNIDVQGKDRDKEVASGRPNNNAPRSHLETLENYGLGSYGVLSTIPDLTQQLMSHLEPYYSPTHRNREEYEIEVASMVVLRTLEGYATSAEMAMAMLARSATERLGMANAIMTRHREELNALVNMMSEELSERGDE